MDITKLMVLGALVTVIVAPHFVYADDRNEASTEVVFVAYDADRSGNLSEKEFNDYMTKYNNGSYVRLDNDFSLIDLDKDKTLSLNELEVGEEIYPLAFR